MHFKHQTKVNDAMQFQYYKEIKKILIDKMIWFCNYMSFATK